MKHFDFNAIKNAGSCVDFVEQVLGEKVVGNRCAAVWRGGVRDSVRVEKDRFFDHVTQQGGGLVELCAISKFGGTGAAEIQKAQEFLGDWLHLDEVKLAAAPGKKNRFSELIAEGYVEKARYEYRDLGGKLIYFVCRMEHPTKRKEFIQGTPTHWGIAGVTPIPYNWKAVHESEWCCIVEGEKDVETLKKLGVPATTNSGGAKKWHHEFSEYLRGKRVIVLPDNDDVGREHAQLIARDLYGIAAEVKIVECSTLPKGDVTDYIEKENGTWDALKAKIDATAVFAPDLTEKGRAREANLTAFSNFELVEVETKRGTRGKNEEKIPRRLNEMIEDLHVRLMGAPYRVGEELFDRDHDTKKINYIYDAAGLFSWIARKTGQVVQWSKIEGCVTKQEFFEALKSEAKVFSAISFTPDYPVRADVYYTHPALPSPSKDNHVFWRFVDFFNPVDEINRSLLTAFIMAPIFYKPMAARPLWIIDSPNGQGSGKSAIPEMVAYLYGEDWNEGRPIDVSLYDLEKNYQEIVKRVISTTGRNARIMRLDNVTGTLRSTNLAMLVTTGSITGRATYGRGEENRPNNLTYVVTINGATVDTDIASRAYYIMVARPKMNPKWSDDIQEYIRENRLQIFADILDIIRNHVPFNTAPITRMPQFEVAILQAACQTEERYKDVLEYLTNKKEETNTDEELARRLEEEIRQHLASVPVLFGRPTINPETDRVFIRSYILEEWFKGEMWLGRKTPTEIIRGMAKTGMIARVDPVLMRWPSNTGKVFQRRSGIMWNYTQRENDVRVLGFTANMTEAQKVIHKSKAVVEIAGD